MPHYVALNAAQHRNLCIAPDKAGHAGANEHLIPVVLNEFAQLVIQYPIVISRHEPSGQLICSAMLGFEERENLFWEEGNWNSLYIPAQIERHPFYIGQQDEQQRQMICIDTQSPALTHSKDKQGARLFTDSGQPTPLMQQKQQLLAMLLEGEIATAQFLAELDRLSLITPIALDVSFCDNSSTKISGLFTIDEDRLAALPGDEIARLHQLGMLSPAYTMLASHAHIYSLIERKNARIQKGEAWFG